MRRRKKTGVENDGFHPKVPLDLTTKTRRKIVEYLVKVKQSGSTRSWSQRPNQSWKKSLVGTLANFVGSNRLSRFVVAKFLESFHHSPFSVEATLVPPAQHMAKRSRPFTDEASKHTSASSKSKPVGKRVLALAAVRHVGAHRWSKLKK